MTLAVVVVAAGRGRRLGGERPKALIEVAGAPLLTHALRRVAELAPTRCVVVHTPGYDDEFRAACEDVAVDALVAGGDTRLESVTAGVRAAGSDLEMVAIHDAARAFTPADVMRAAVAAVEEGAVAAAPGVPVADTLKDVREGEVIGTVPRDTLWAVQTPQVFRRSVLVAALEAGPSEGVTDDLSLVEHARDAGLVSGEIVLVRGSARARKVTYREDLELAELLAVRGER
ncbi:MAG: 2-C-methyl-D-erythritol 4-phosphate cytidylyltransferase [Nitriliruptorales bacterium]|nr:2-C-methyl-D-erythritol 4-phosphate cytidylyltransferase [Nitriliruptorales bacterium]